MATIREVISELRLLYPDLEILVWEKNNKSQLIVNEKTIFKFEPDFMEKYLKRFGEDALKETIKIWAEYIEIRYIKRLKRFKKENGRPALGFSESQIKFAISNTKSNSAASRFLNVSYNTFSKYARIHGMFEVNKNQSGKGILKGGRRSKVPWTEIFDNKHPNYDLPNLKRRLIAELIIEEKCEVCGYNTRRDFDDKMSIVLDFKDGNVQNMSRDNMRLLCYNCKYNTGKRLGKRVLGELKQVFDSHKAEEQREKDSELWDEMNPPSNTQDEPVIIQTNTDDEVWNKFNK